MINTEPTWLYALDDCGIDLPGLADAFDGRALRVAV